MDRIARLIAAGWAASLMVAASPTEGLNVPPLGPESEHPVAGPPAKTAPGCLALLHRLTLERRDRVGGLLVSDSQRWGVVLRADILSNEGGVAIRTRFVCPLDPHYGVLISTLLDTQPLASGPWGEVRPYP